MWFLNLLAGAFLLLPFGGSFALKGRPVPQFYNSARHAGADPYVLYDSKSGQYYAYSTEGADEGSLFAIYSSPDLSTWHRHPGGVLKACYDADMNRVKGGQACWARDWHWAPETYYNEKTGWYFFFFAGRLREDLSNDYFRYSKFEEPSKIGVAVSRSPTGPFREIKSKPIDYYPFDPGYHDVNLIMDEKQMLPPQSLKKGQTAPKGTFIPTIDANVFFDKDGRIYLYTSRNAYRNWNWDDKLKKYIEESNIIVVELERDWWDDPKASTMPEIAASQKNIHAKDAPPLPHNITSYNGTGEIGNPPRKDGWKTVISYGADPQEWENFHVDDYKKYNGERKDRRWSEGSTLIRRPGKYGIPVYFLTYSANNFEASNYGVGFASSKSPLGPFRKSSNNPILSQEPDAEIPIYSTGHGSIVASPPRNKRDNVGAQEVTLRTPEGSELFYVHHARNDTTHDRSIYTTRMKLHEAAIYVGSDDAISMDLTPLDQPLPKNTYPITVEAKCSRKNKAGRQFHVRVTSKPGAPFDLVEGSNRVVALPGSQKATSIEQDHKRAGSFVLKFGDDRVKELAYQRLGVDGTWSTVAKKRVSCY
ncbi:glycoside hydrolase family 43 [Fusarium albosuccineum]|uniref:Glycoside hydrolase family 43 n=1 Tax=Fusarium albosuccineum TaxID=1237068 RepID=A0A8H4P7T9_9HYPO|nr:glycoside hydrolase family 43 [Fusarium albosuccineum]